MKKINFIAAVLMAAGIAALLSSCEKNGGNDNGTEDNELKGYVTSDLTLSKGETYYLTGSLHVQAPATLTVEAGATVIASDNGEINYILIEQGARIKAVGTASAPVVFTAEKKANGAWGGIHICGKAHTNAGSGNTSEIGNAPYGGDVEDDNSGVMKYVRIEYSGYALDSEHEANGLSLYGVGSGTELSYIQAYMGSDDGIEFFGGSVNIDHCVVVDCTDDCFDWTEGWNGKGEYLVAYQTDPSCDCLMECDNNGKNFDAAPVASPTLNYLTLVGNSSTENTKGIRLRAGTYASISNALVSGKSSPITLETAQTVASFKSGASKFENVLIAGQLSCKEDPAFTNDDFVAAGGNKADQTISLTDRFIGKVGTSGAVDASDNWTSGWTK